MEYCFTGIFRIVLALHFILLHSRKKLFTHSRKQYRHCWIFSKEDSLFHFHWSSSYIVMTCLACRLTSLSGKHGNLPCHQLCGRKIREQTKLPGSQLQRRLPGLRVPSQPVLGMSGWYKECYSTNLGTTCLICRSPANLGVTHQAAICFFIKSFDRITSLHLSAAQKLSKNGSCGKVSTSSVRSLVDQRLEGCQAHGPIRSLMVP